MRKRHGNRLLMAETTKRDAFVAEHQALRTLADGATLFFVDEAHFRAGV